MSDATDRTRALASTEQASLRAVPGETLAPSQPHQIGRYLVIRTLGSGAMGVVYSAYDEELDRRVAIKLLRTDLRGTVRSRGLGRMRREAQALAKLSHPNVVQVYDVGEYAGQIFVAMEFIRGQTLREWLDDRRHDIGEILDIYVQAGRGLAAAHSAGLVHRDFKPDNVIVGDDGRVRVLDFGVARAGVGDDEPSGEFPEGPSYEQRRPDLTEAGMLIGTPAYMAPEQFLARPTDARSDLFGFCVALYEALYGERPFKGKRIDELKAEVLSGVLPAPPEDRQVPARLHRLLARGLQLEPQDRYPSMDALLDDLTHDPSAARRRAFLLAGAAVFVIAAVVGALSYFSSTATCDAVATELDALYNPARRQRIADAILASSVPFARSTWERAAPHLDAYARAWSAARLDACQAHLDGRQSPRLYDLRTACLDQRRAGFAALLDVFEHADDATIPKLAEAVLALPRLDPCADTAALTAALPPPEDPDTADAVQRIRERLAEIKAYESAGRYAQAGALLDPLQADAAALAYPPIQIEVQLRRGTLAMWQYQFDAADRALSDALFDAIAEGHDHAAADALARKIYVKGVQNPEEARRELRLGDALLRRVRGDSELEATYHNNVGVLEAVGGNMDEARRAFERALDIKRNYFGERHLEVGYTLSNLGQLDTDAGHFLRARVRFLDAITILEEALGPDHIQTAALLSNIANAHARSADWSRAQASYDKMDAIFASSRGAWAEMGAYILPDRGDFHRAIRHYDDAARDYEETLRLLASAPEGDQKPVLWARVGLTALAAAREDWDDVARRLADLAGPMDAAESPAPLLIADAIDLRAALLGRQSDPDGRLREHTRAFQLRVAKTPEHSPLRARAHLAFARALLDLGRVAEVASHLRDARTIIEAELTPASPELPTLERLGGELALAEGDLDAAIRHFRRAVDLLRDAREADDFDLALARFDLARALRRADPSAAEARDLADSARATLLRRGPAWTREADAIDAWLRRPSEGTD